MRLRILATAGLLAITTGFVAPALAQRSTIEAPEASSGLETYAEPSDAVKAGDIAAFMGFLKADEDYEIVSSSFRAMLLSIDAIAEENYQAAREALNDVREDGEETALSTYMSSWILAFEGDAENAVDQHRSAAAGLPGLTADLSLAALLEGLGRDDEALAVYASLTPSRIEAPDHDFDAAGIYFAHVQTVIARRAILLRRLGRIEDAKDVYRRLAESQPEQAVRYAALIQTIEEGKHIDTEPLSLKDGFSRTLTDISLAMYQQRVFQNAQRGRRTVGFDEMKSVLNQAALLISPDDEDLRNLVISGLHREAFYDGAARVALAAPNQTPDLAMSAALALMLDQDQESALEALDGALDLDAKPEERLGHITRAARLYSLLGDQSQALELTTEALEIADNPSEEAFANTSAADVLQHYARYEEALPFAREAVRLDDTHDRRLYLTTVLGELGRHEEALQILRSEQLGRANDPYMLNTLGYYLVIHTDEYEEAYRLLGRALAGVARNDPYIQDSFGWARYKLGDLEGALRVIESSMRELSPSRHWEIEDHLGDIKWHLGETEEARDWWTKALELYPPLRVRNDLEDKIENGLQEPAPERRPLPSLLQNNPAELTERDI
ncbi:MAG: tetratricopeptide repeat protein [Pseudomonadota bacterium]